MAVEQTTITAAGIANAMSCRVEFPRGIEPGRILIECAGFADAPEPVLDITIAGSLSQTLTFVDCLLIGCSATPTGGRPGYTYTFADRRWRWQFGRVDGEFNVAQPGAAALWPKTARQLAALCLDELGEVSYDVSALPDAQGPEVRWDAANPAESLDEVCAAYQCAVGFNDSNRVVIFRDGVGSGAPTLANTKQRTFSAELAPLPSEYQVVTGPTEWETALTLEAVGEDLDGTIKPINDLSYKPAGVDWVRSIYGKHRRVSAGKARDLATRDVGKLWRVAGVAAAGEPPEQFNPPSYPIAGMDWPDVAAATDLVPRPYRAGFHTLDGRKVPNPLQVVGRFLDPDEDGDKDDEMGAWPDRVSYQERGRLVRLSKHAIRNGEGDEKAIATLWLVCCVRVRHAERHAMLRYAKRLDQPDPEGGSLPLVDHHAELVLQHFVDPPTLAAGEIVVTPNAAANAVAKADIDEACDYYLAGLTERFARKPAGSVTAYGLWAVGHAGDIHHVRWSVGGGPPTTVVTVNTRPRGDQPSFDEAKRRAALARANRREKARARQKWGKS